MKLQRRYYIRLDLGKEQDHSAIAAVERCVWTTEEKDPIRFAPKQERHTGLRHIERVHLKTKYKQVVARVREMLLSEALRHECVVFAFDATGVGEAVLEMVEDMMREVRAQRLAWIHLAAVVFTSGGKTHWKQYEAHVPKNTLMDELVMRVERQELLMDQARPGVKEFLRELQNMQQVRGENGTRLVSVGEHDDMVMALALAVWGSTYRDVPKNWKDLRRGRPSWEVEAMRNAKEAELPERERQG